MDPVNVATVLVAIIAAVSAYASQRSAAKASVMNTTTTSRVDMEKEAYDRARAFDTETIRRQEKELERLRAENEGLHNEVNDLRIRVSRLEAALPYDVLETLNVQRDEPEDPHHQ